MKKIILFLVGVFLLTNSCSRDDNSSGSETSIVGKWQLSHTVLNGTVTYNGAVANVKDFKVNATDCQKKAICFLKMMGQATKKLGWKMKEAVSSKRVGLIPIVITHLQERLQKHIMEFP